MPYCYTQHPTQPSAAPTPPGYLADVGQIFGVRAGGYSYGRNTDNTAAPLDRNSNLSPDQRYDTVTAPGNATWELAVPNGSYRVHVVSGDVTSTTGVYRISVEGVLIVDAAPMSIQCWFEGWCDLLVSDGRLSLTSGPGAQNNKLNFIDVIPMQ